MRRAYVGWLGAVIVVATFGGLGACTSGGAVSSTGAGASSGTATSTSTTTPAATVAGITLPSGNSVLQHHNNPSRDGVYIAPALTKAAAAGLKVDTGFNATVVKGAVYAQPLFVDGGAGGKDLLFVATELNNVHALDAATGAEVWTKNLGGSVPLSAMPCGNIDPYGITGTPIIDLASRTIFLDAMTTPDGGATKHHSIFALSIDTGAVKAGWPVDVASTAKSGSTSFNTAPQSQRGALALVGGTLFVPFGGLYGDCGDYHGWVVAVSIADPTQVHAWATSAQAGGAWAPGGISSDGTHVYVTTGNTEGANNVWGGGNAILRFDVAAFGTPSSYFTPMNWQDLDNADLDLVTGPVLFDLAGSSPGQLAISFGKDGKAYLLDRNNLGGVSATSAYPQVASGLIISAPAVYTTATATYVAFKADGTMCTGGTSGDLSTLKIVPGSPPTLAASWCATVGSGSPIVTTTDGHANAIVWNTGADGNGYLMGFDGDTGATIFAGGGTNIPNLRRYNTPIVAKGRIFVAADSSVTAFKP